MNDNTSILGVAPFGTYPEHVAKRALSASNTTATFLLIGMVDGQLAETQPPQVENATTEQ